MKATITQRDAAAPRDFVAGCMVCWFVISMMLPECWGSWCCGCYVVGMTTTTTGGVGSDALLHLYKQILLM